MAFSDGSLNNIVSGHSSVNPHLEAHCKSGIVFLTVLEGYTHCVTYTPDKSNIS